MDTSASWEDRFERVVQVLYWLTLAIGVFLVFFKIGTEPRAYGAVGLCGAYVVFISVLPGKLARRDLIRQTVIVLGAASSMTAVGLTGGLDSPFLLFALIPVLDSAVVGGFRAGLGAAALSAGILTSLVLPINDPNWAILIQWVVLFLLVAVTFGYANRLLLQQGIQFTALAAATAETSSRLERLETAHALLTRLAAQAEAAELNPIEVGNAALESARVIVPFAAANVSLASDSGPVVVARMGDAPDHSETTLVSLRVGEREVGSVVLATDREVTQRQKESLDAALQPAGLAFANVLLLQSIARTAIKEERTRLARDLHDDIGPSLASLGLALDLAGLQHHAEPVLAAHLQDLRDSVGSLVENVRTTVADLRVPGEVPSLREVVFDIIRGRPGSQPAVLFQLNERHQARPSIAADINAIVTEVVRNAIRHADASTITIRGTVDFESGAIEIADDGSGFQADTVPPGHYGLIGIRERATRIKADVRMDSTSAGTTFLIRWGRR